ncbi:MAG: methylamine utilization protein [Betaproteobacteria bacterium]
MRILIGLTLIALTAHAALAQNAIVATVVDDNGKPVADAVVVAVPADGATRLPMRRDVVIDQVDKEFTPKVNAILVGTPVIFPNHDNVRHQVYSFSPAKRFELPLYAGMPAQPVMFDAPGVVVLGCNIHDWMVGYIYVSESPYFAKTGADGKAVITDLPARAYVVRVWHPQLEGGEAATKKSVDVTGKRRVELEWALKLKPEVRVRRSPIGEHNGHY